MQITRREFCQGTATLALTAALLGSSALIGAEQALAQRASDAELLKPNPLGEMVMGDAKAPVTIIEYASMTCSHCAHFAANTFPELKKRYINTGKVRYMLREFPLDPLAAAGFLLARCAAKDDANKYYAFVDTLFHSQATWAFVKEPVPPLRTIAKQAGLSDKGFNDCLANQPMLDKLETARRNASEKLGVKSTPTFFINGEKHEGDMSIDDLAKLIDPYVKAG